MTASSFETVVDWYRQQLPPGWRNESISDLQRLANSLSLQPDAAAGQAPRKQVAMFFPPRGTTGSPGVMIVAQDGQPVDVLLKK